MLPRLRRLLPHAIGLGLALALLWQGSSELEHVVLDSENFAVIVDDPTPVFDLDAEPRPFTARVAPLEDATRSRWHVDDRSLPLKIGEEGQVSASLTELFGDGAAVPGWHFIETRIDRRGGRSESVVDPVLVGRFGHAEVEKSERCDIALSASEDLIQALVVPLFEAQALPKLRENQHMGPDTTLEKAELELRDHTVHFDLEIAGENTLAVSGLVAIWVDEERRLYLHLVLLEDVEFRGELRGQATSMGAGGGALVGGLIAGPLAPVGAIAGWWVADDYVTDQARKTVRKQLDDGLAALSGVELLPASIELLPGEPRSRVELGFCKRTGVHPGGLVAGLWIEPTRDTATRFELGVSGPLVTGAQPHFVAIDDEDPEDIRVELSIDLVNSLLTEWTRTGLLLEALRVPAMLEHANAELDEWSPLKLTALHPTRPPLLTPAGGPEQGWSFGLGGLVVETTGTDQPWGTIRVGGAGTLQPMWDAKTGTMKLAGTVDRLAVTCEQVEGAHSILRPCFASVLEAVELRDRLDARLRPDSEGMPGLAIGDLLASKLALAITSLELSRPLPGVLRLSATVAAEPGQSPP